MYSIDTSIIITAWRDHYWPATFPGLWERFNRSLDDGTFVASEEVYRELLKRDDQVAAWAKARRNVFVPLDADTQMAAASVLQTHPKLLREGNKTSAADPFVIGLGAARGFTVATCEGWSNGVDKPHIPNVCSDKNIPYTDMQGLITQNGWVF
jgi:hypothetical protein